MLDAIIFYIYFGVPFVPFVQLACNHKTQVPFIPQGNSASTKCLLKRISVNNTFCACVRTEILALVLFCYSVFTCLLVFTII